MCPPLAVTTTSAANTGMPLCSCRVLVIVPVPSVLSLPAGARVSSGPMRPCLRSSPAAISGIRVLSSIGRSTSIATRSRGKGVARGRSFPAGVWPEDSSPFSFAALPPAVAEPASSSPFPTSSAWTSMIRNVASTGMPTVPAGVETASGGPPGPVADAGARQPAINAGPVAARKIPRMANLLFRGMVFPVRKIEK